MVDSTLPIEVTTRGNGDIDTNRYFESAWKLWPRKTNKVAARKAFGRALKSFTADLLAGEVTGPPVVAASPASTPALADTIRRFGVAYTHAGTDPQFVPHLATWLNQQRWTDTLPAAQQRPQHSDTPRGDYGAGNEWMEFGR